MDRAEEIMGRVENNVCDACRNEGGWHVQDGTFALVEVKDTGLDEESIIPLSVAACDNCGHLRLFSTEFP